MARLLAMSVALLLCGCGATAQPEVRTLPNVADLDRMASGSHGARDLVEATAGVTEYVDLPTRGWLLEPGPGENSVEYVILRVPYDEEVYDGLTLTQVWADTPDDISGEVYMGVADYESGAWQWQDCSAEGWYEGYDYMLAVPLEGLVNVWSPEGYMYVCVIAHGEGSRAVANGLVTVRWPAE